mmetsp:Transcript_95141/g.258221  ORF Transcript_95141/g.258221 Transcript_95141/m.258221 type:complete len:118 (+) Transcript_95141:554-907(+)
MLPPVDELEDRYIQPAKLVKEHSVLRWYTEGGTPRLHNPNDGIQRLPGCFDDCIMLLHITSGVWKGRSIHKAEIDHIFLAVVSYEISGETLADDVFSTTSLAASTDVKSLLLIGHCV